MLKEKFLNLMGAYSNDGHYNLECWNEIEHNYCSNRYYHNLEHLENMLAELDKVVSDVKDLDTLLFAIYYHDIIYKPTKNNNEHQSAMVFQKRISKTTFEYVSSCMAQIESTKEHNLSQDDDTNILLDLDLSILGKTPQEYKKYSDNIRKEYHMYPDFIYRKGRIKVLKSLLDLDSIYKTVFFKNAYEAQAKKNVRLELNQLN